jgi:hypothetical protein
MDGMFKSWRDEDLWMAKVRVTFRAAAGILRYLFTGTVPPMTTIYVVAVIALLVLVAGAVTDIFYPRTVCLCVAFA